MLFIDLLLILSTLIFLIFGGVFKRRFNKRVMVSMLFSLIIIQLIIVGYRWQMIPTYLLWGIALFLVFSSYRKKSSIGFILFKSIGLLIILIIAIVAPLVFPLFELPDPSGPYSVGTRDILIELDRDEVITKTHDDKRRLMIKAWYPSLAEEGEKDKYVDPAGRNGFAQKYGLPTSIFNYLNRIDTKVLRDIEIANSAFPVLIFSHGYNSKANSYYSIISELVSHGFIIFAINHTYESTGSTFPDGSEVYFDYEYAQNIQSNTWHLMEPVIKAFKSDKTFEDRHPIVKEGLRNYFVKDMVERWAMDITDVVSKITEWNNSGFFKGRLDESRIGVFGHSRGGGAAGEALLTDKRIKAGANLDGVQWGRIVDTSFQQPFLFLSADWPEDHEDLNSHAYINKSTRKFYKGLIRESAHSNFMDVPLMIPIRKLSEAGAIDPKLGIEITTRVLTAFFDQHLKLKKINWQSMDAKYNNLELHIFKGDSVKLGENNY